MLCYTYTVFLVTLCLYRAWFRWMYLDNVRSPWRWRKYVRPKRRNRPTLYGVKNPKDDSLVRNFCSETGAVSNCINTLFFFSRKCKTRSLPFILLLSFTAITVLSKICTLIFKDQIDSIIFVHWMELGFIPYERVHRIVVAYFSLQ